MKLKQILKTAALSLAVCFLTALLIMISFANNHVFKDKVISLTEEHLLTIAHIESLHLSRRIESVFSELKCLSENPNVKESIVRGNLQTEKPADEIYIPERVSQHNMGENCSALYRLDANGIVQNRIPWKPNKAGNDYSKKPGVKKVLQTRKPYMSSVFTTGSGKKCFSICYPVFEKQKFVGVLRSIVDMETIHECMSDSNIGGGGYAVLVDGDGIFISHPKKDNIGKSLSGVFNCTCDETEKSDVEKIINCIKRGKEGTGRHDFVLSVDGKQKTFNKLAAFVPVDIEHTDWTLLTVTDYAKISKPVAVHARNMHVSMLIMLLIFVLAGGYYYRIHKIKMVLETRAESAGKLEQINHQLKKEIAERKTAEVQLIEAKKFAESANVAKSQFLANMSHEIRTPMNGIIGFSDILSEEDLNEDQIKYVEIIRSSGQNLLSIINDILDFTKIEAGKMDIESIDTSLADILRSIKYVMKERASEKDIEFEIFIDKKVPGYLNTDPTRLNQCLLNLINNAIKFTEEGHVYLYVSCDEHKGVQMLHFDVEDTGKGIPKNKINTIFESFTQADSSTTRKHGGTGLGLTITRQISEFMGGEVSVVSQEDSGSVFTLFIPCGDVSEETKNKIETEHNDDDIFSSDNLETMFTGKALVAEDNNMNMKLIKLLLEKHGFEVVVAENGKEALAAVEKNDIDIIFMDIMMPEMSGFEATKILRQRGVDLPIIALTAKSLVGDKDKCLQAGCDAYLPKPLNQKKLINLISNYIKVGAA